MDLNSDGFFNLVVTSLDGRPRIPMKNGLSSHQWIKLDPRSHTSNRAPISV